MPLFISSWGLSTTLTPHQSYRTSPKPLLILSCSSHDLSAYPHTSTWPNTRTHWSPPAQAKARAAWARLLWSLAQQLQVGHIACSCHHAQLASSRQQAHHSLRTSAATSALSAVQQRLTAKSVSVTETGGRKRSRKTSTQGFKMRKSVCTWLISPTLIKIFLQHFF